MEGGLVECRGNYHCHHAIYLFIDKYRHDCIFSGLGGGRRAPRRSAGNNIGAISLDNANQIHEREIR